MDSVALRVHRIPDNCPYRNEYAGDRLYIVATERRNVVSAEHILEHYLFAQSIRGPAPENGLSRLLPVFGDQDSDVDQLSILSLPCRRAVMRRIILLAISIRFFPSGGAKSIPSAGWWHKNFVVNSQKRRMDRCLAHDGVQQPPWEDTGDIKVPQSFDAKTRTLDTVAGSLR